MSQCIHVEKKYDPWFPSDSRDSVDALARHFDVDLHRLRSRNLIVRRGLKDRRGFPVTFFFKAYASRKHAFHGFCRRSRALSEARNLRNFSEWGIPTASVAACGAERRWGLCSHLSCLVTEEVSEAKDLRSFWLNPDVSSSKDVRYGLIRQLAEQTRCIHEHHFFHQDLKWRNLMVAPRQNGPRIHWIDCPNGYFSRIPPRQHHGRIKDLATLDKVAKDLCTKEERLLFVQCYLEQSETNRLVRHWAEKVQRYRKRRQE